MTLSLDILKPRSTRVEIFDNYGHSLAVLPVKTLSFTQWNNAALMVSVPKRTKRVEIGQPEVDISHTPEYREKVAQYNEEITLRRIAIALEDAFPELQGLSLDDQVKTLRELDTGIINGLAKFLQGVALQTSADIFRAKPVSGNGHGDLSKTEVDIEPVDETNAD